MSATASRRRTPGLSARRRPARRPIAAQRREHLRAAARASTSTSRAFDPSEGPTISRDSSRSMRRPALANPTRSLRCSIEVEPNCVLTTSSAAASRISRSSPMSPSIWLLGDRPRHPRRYSGRACAVTCLTTVGDLVLGDPGALHADRLRRAHRQEQPVALADQLVGARLVEDDARVGHARHGEGQARRHVRLDEAGDDIHRRTLGREHQVDAGCARQLGDAHDRVLDVARGDHHQVGELVDDDQQVRVGLEHALAAGRQHDLVGDTALLKSSMCRKPKLTRGRRSACPSLSRPTAAPLRPSWGS